VWIKIFCIFFSEKCWHLQFFRSNIWSLCLTGFSDNAPFTEFKAHWSLSHQTNTLRLCFLSGWRRKIICPLPSKMKENWLSYFHWVTVTLSPKGEFWGQPDSISLVANPFYNFWLVLIRPYFVLENSNFCGLLRVSFLKDFFLTQWFS
jgi:hypothetical protein